MANNLGHPYANALFEVAKADNTVDAWLTNLERLSEVASSEDFAGLIDNPKIAKEAIIEVLLGFLDKAPKSVRQFLELLQENDRLAVLPDIYTLFEHKVELERNTARAVIQSAYALNDADTKKFEQLLSKKFDKAITVTVEVHKDLIGGIKILINDTVIDYSVKGSLANLTTQLIS